MKKINRFFMLLIFSILLSACGGSKLLISRADIQEAKKNGTLEKLYQRTTSLVSENRGSTRKDLTRMQSEIAKLLTLDSTSLVNRTIKEQATEYGLVSRETLVNLIAKTSNMKFWDNERFKLVSSMLKKLLNKTETEISSALSKAKNNADNLVNKMKWLRMAALLSGTNQKENEKYQEELAKMVEQLSSKGRNAYKRRMYNISMEAALNGVAIDPGNIQFEALLMQSQAALFEQSFKAALENGKPESAYQAFVEVSNKPLMRQIREKMEKSILLLANYFASNAQKAYQRNDLLTAYNEFQRARDIQKRLSLTSFGFIQEKKFLDLIMQKTNVQPIGDGKKLALLKLVQEFDPAYPLLEQNMLKIQKDIYKRATTKLSVSEFKEVTSSNSVVASVGRRVASKLEKTLFKELGNELQIITNSAGIQSDDFSGIVLAIDGEVLQAAIETSRNKGQRSINVLTEVRKTESKEYKKWKKRQRGETPTRYLEEKIMEDVTIQVEHIRKLAVVEVAYRIIEPSTQKVLLTDTIVKEANYKGDSTNEFQKGLFHQVYVAANLPSDIKIMDNLASELSLELGQALTRYLASPENVFFQKYQASVAQGNQTAAIEMLSNAVVIAEKKGKANAAWLTELKKQVLTLK